MEAANTTQDLTDTCWRDELWLRYNQLNTANVIRDYFSLSPFYDRQCNNEVLKQRNLDISKLWTLPSGVEYVIHAIQEPHLYVIKKQFRHGPDAVTAQAFYYIHTGTIYQAPTLHSTVYSRWKRCVHLVHKSFKKMQSDLDTLLEWKKDYKRKRNDSAAVHPSFTKDDKERFSEGVNILMATIKNFPAPQVPSLSAEDVPESTGGSVQVDEANGASHASITGIEDKISNINGPVEEKLSIEQNSVEDLNTDGPGDRQIKRQKR